MAAFKGEEGDVQYFWEGVTWHFIGGRDNYLETMLSYLILISLGVAIYTFQTT